MPTVSLDVFIEHGRERDVSHLAEVAAHLRVTTIALSWRLRSLGRIDEATREELARVRVDVTNNDVPKLFSESLVKQLHAALDKGRVTARKAAKALGMSLAELYELFASYGLSDPFRS